MRLLSCAQAGSGAGRAAPVARAAAPPNAVRRLIMKLFDIVASCLVAPFPPELLVEYLGSRCGPADMDGLANLRRKTAFPIGDLHDQPVAGRQPDMDVDQGAEIRHEFHSTGQAVVESGPRLQPDLDPLGP